jgi:hypothetical protein
MQQRCIRGIAIIDQQFLLFLAQLPAAPSSARVALWRRLRGAGAASMLNGAWVLPRTDEYAALLAQLTGTVRGQGGNANVFAIQEMSPTETESIVARFRTDRAREYDEFEDRSRAFLAEIERETQRRKFTFAELEEIEDDLEKLSTWLDKIRTRDFFPSGNSQTAAETLERCLAAFQTFAAAVYSQEGVAMSVDQDEESEKRPR